jgi:hypothetical protein
MDVAFLDHQLDFVRFYLAVTQVRGSYNIAMYLTVAFIPDEQSDPIVIANLVLHDFRPAVLKDHDSVAFVLRDLILRNLRNRSDAHDSIILFGGA